MEIKTTPLLSNRNIDQYHPFSLEDIKCDRDQYCSHCINDTNIFTMKQKSITFKEY